MQEGEPQYEYWLRSANEERGVTEVRVQRNVHKHYDFLFKWKGLHKLKRHFFTSVGPIVIVAATAAAATAATAAIAATVATAAAAVCRCTLGWP